MIPQFIVRAETNLLNFVMPTPAPACDIEQALYQLIISRIDGPKLVDQDYRKSLIALVGKGIGGFIIFGGQRNVVAPFLAEAQERAGIPLFIASDIERGVRQQIEGTTAFPCNMAMAAATDPDDPESGEHLRRAVRAVSAEARAIGINMPLIPVLDVNLNPDNPIVCTRAFSDNPAVVGSFGSTYCRTLTEEGLIACAKHFPGHGDTSVDSHISLPVISKPEEALLAKDIAPFRKVIGEGVPAIMIGHLLIPSLDDRPASLSRRIMSDLLRDELGFEGIVMTDALTMNALREYGDASVEAFQAGADILLHPDNADRTVSLLLNALIDGRINETMVISSFDRIQRCKQIMGKSDKPLHFSFADHAALARELAGAAVTAVKRPAGISHKENIRLIAAGETAHFMPDLWRPFCSRVSQIIGTGASPDSTDVIVIFTSVAAWKGSSGIPEEERCAIDRIIAASQCAIVVSFGSPYVLRYFEKAAGLIAAYDASPVAQEAVIACLSGTVDYKGRLPVVLKMK